MALTLLNHFYWKVPEAKVPFIVADVVIVVALRYLEKGILAEAKLKEIQEHHADQDREMKKEEKIAQKQQARSHNHKHANKTNKHGGNGGGRKNNFNIKGD